MLKNHFILIFFFILLFSCSYEKKINPEFIKLINDNKNSFYLYLVNDNATTEFFNLFHEHGNNIYDSEGNLIVDYTLSENELIFNYHDINNRIDERMLGYVIVYKENINIGKYINKITIKPDEVGFSLKCHLDTEGSNILYEFTKDNINKSLAIVFNNNVIAYPRIILPVKNSLSVWIND